MLKLNFDLVTSQERTELVNQFFSENPNYKPSANELDTISNYILYGKDDDGESTVDRHEIEIETKYKSYSKRKVESLNSLMETPGFNENTIVEHHIFRTPKPTIDREADAAIPGMRDLWAAIDYWAYVLGVCEGSVEPDPARPVRQYTPTQLYKLKHNLIDLRKQQYVLKEAYGGTEHLYSPNVHKAAAQPSTQHDIEWDNYWFFPLGLYNMAAEQRFEHPRDAAPLLSPWDRTQSAADAQSQGYQIIDFTNPAHIYLLAKSYQDLTIAAEQNVDSVAGALIRTLDFYYSIADFDDIRADIWRMKCGQQSNEQIRDWLSQTYGTGYNENYISTIFKKGICEDMAATARLHYDYYLNRDNPTAWKVCSCCGQTKLRDTREFMRKAKGSDGLASKCKKCEKKARAARKAASRPASRPANQIAKGGN